jgi:hypothetical protein
MILTSWSWVDVVTCDILVDMAIYYKNISFYNFDCYSLQLLKNSSDMDMSTTMI